MALGWMTALKLVPWGEVIEATPQIMQAARKLMSNTRKAPADAPAQRIDSTPDHIAALQARLAQLEEDQRSSAVLIESLAEQNAQLVRAVDGLRRRGMQLLLAVCALGVCTFALLAWALSR
ncbi:hypothetical protein [Diaphorobacter sp.]|uniref:hypothetical protein n=1 Tax=Diaphorobacter sp. TaxID=1934310 RepID=UPI003D09916D